jgi:hypothetical protein
MKPFKGAEIPQYPSVSASWVLGWTALGITMGIFGFFIL